MEKYIVVKIDDKENNIGTFEKLERLKQKRENIEESTRKTIESLQMENLMKMAIYINDLYESYKKIGGLAECHRFIATASLDDTLAELCVEAREYKHGGVNTLISFGYSIGQDGRFYCDVLDNEIRLPQYTTNLGKVINDLTKSWHDIKRRLETQVKNYRYLEEKNEIEKINNIKSMLENATNFEL